MRIVYLINGLNGGGAAFPMVQVLGLMRELGHEVRVVALMRQDMKAAARLEQAGIPYELIGEGLRDFIAPALRLVRNLRRDRPDLLWTSLSRGAIYGQLIGRLLGIRVVSWQHSDSLKRLNLAILRRTGGLASRWIADSESVRHFTQDRLGVPPERIEVWAPFVADADAPMATAWDGGSRLQLGTLGRLHSSKQYEVLLRAFALAHERDPALAKRIELSFAGDGPEEAALQALCDKLRLRGAVRFLGFVEQPKQFLAGLHGYVQTSLKEGFCIAAHEAMQAGLPVIATRVGELAWNVRPGETGWLCEVGDVEALAQAILALARDPHTAAAFGRTARARVLERYSRARFRGIGETLLRDIEHGLGEPPAALPQRDGAP